MELLNSVLHIPASGDHTQFLHGSTSYSAQDPGWCVDSRKSTRIFADVLLVSKGTKPRILGAPICGPMVLMWIREAPRHV